MGKVYLAYDPKLERHVALKILRGRDASEDMRTRFRREGWTIAQLRHPNVVTVFDIDEDVEGPFLTMEYIPGRTLAQIVADRDTLSIGRKLELLAAACSGLSCAHDKNIIHRDIKPANLIVDTAGILKIVDFGVAKVVTSGTQLSAGGSNAGTIGYMSPEQIAGARLDHRTDIYSLAIVAYEFISMRRAFAGAMSSVVMAITKGELPPLPGDLPSAVARIINRGVAIDREERYPSALAMQRDIVNVRAELEKGSSIEPTLVGADHVLRGWADPAPAPPYSLAPSTVLISTLGGSDDGSRGIEQRKSRHTRWLVSGVLAGTLIVAGAWLWPSVTGERKSGASAAKVVRSDLPARPAGNLLGTASVKPSAPATPVSRRPGLESAKRAATTAARRGESPGVEIAPPPTARQIAEPAQIGPRITSAPAVPPPPTSNEPTWPANPSTTSENPTLALLSLTADDENAIRRTLRQFENAFENQSTAALKAVEPSLNTEQLAAWDRAFAENASYRVEIVNPRIGIVRDGRARVDCALARTIIPKGGETRRLSGVATLVMDRTTDGNWLISRVVGVGWQ